MTRGSQMEASHVEGRNVTVIDTPGGAAVLILTKYDQGFRPSPTSYLLNFWGRLIHHKTCTMSSAQHCNEEELMRHISLHTTSLKV